jgi:hypothetical protein
VSLARQRPDDVLALERAALDRWAKGDVEGFPSLDADDISYFDPTQETASVVFGGSASFTDLKELVSLPAQFSRAVRVRLA